MLIITLFVQQLQAQQIVEHKIRLLEQQRIEVQEHEKDALKEEIKAINERLEKGEITEDEAQRLKEEAAKIRALNIENKLAIIDNQIELVKRGEDESINPQKRSVFEFDIGMSGGEDDILYGIRYKRRNKPIKFDKKTKSDLVLAFGLNNAIIDGEGLNDSPYQVGGSRFFEIGWAWTTRVFENSNVVRFKYGFSFQFNGLNPTKDRYFVDNEGVTELETYSQELKKAKFRSDNLVIPLHFEFGPSRVIKRENYIRYSTYKKFRFGIGGYAGVNLSARQKLKYELDGKNVKDKMKSDYNTSNFVYGLSSYIGKGDTSLYFKYDLNPLFNDTGVEQNNISLGIRFDL